MNKSITNMSIVRYFITMTLAKKCSVFIAFIIVTTFTIPVFAQNQNNSVPPNMPKNFEDVKNVQTEANEKAQVIRQEIEEKKESGRMQQTEMDRMGRPGGMETTTEGNRCEMMTQKVTRVVGGIGSSHQGQNRKYGLVIKRLENIIAMALEKNIDTSALSAGIATLRELVSQLETNHETFVTALQSTKDFECGTAQGELRTAYEESKTALGMIRQDITAIQEHYKTVIRPELETIKTQMEALEAVASPVVDEATPASSL